MGHCARREAGSHRGAWPARGRWRAAGPLEPVLPDAAPPALPGGLPSPRPAVSTLPKLCYESQSLLIPTVGVAVAGQMASACGLVTALAGPALGWHAANWPAIPPRVINCLAFAPISATPRPRTRIYQEEWWLPPRSPLRGPGAARSPPLRCVCSEQPAMTLRSLCGGRGPFFSPLPELPTGRAGPGPIRPPASDGRARTAEAPSLYGPRRADWGPRLGRR